MIRNTRLALVSIVSLLSLASLSACTSANLPNTYSTAQPSVSFNAEEELYQTSRLDKRGVAKIIEKNQLSLDLTENILTKEAVHFDSENPAPEIRRSDGSLINANITTRNRSINLKVDAITFEETQDDPYIRKISLLRPFDIKAGKDLIQEVRDSVEKYGIDAEAVALWVEKVSKEENSNYSETFYSKNTLSDEPVIQLDVEWNPEEERKFLTYHVIPENNPR